LSLIWARKTQFRYVLKELFIALCYALGVSLVPIYLTWPLGTLEFLFILRIFAIALANLFLFSVMEAKPDMVDHHPSAIRFMGFRTLNGILQAILWINLVTGV